MNVKSLQSHVDANRGMFTELAKCGSVAELMIRLAAYGKSWNRWSWAIFVHFLWLRINYEESNYIQPHWSLNGSRTDEPECCAMLNDILATLDNGTELDSVMTNKVVVKSMLQIIDAYCAECKKSDETSSCAGLLCVLAHTFAKFPKMWNVNWMYIRHTSLKKKAIRTHRLAHLVPVSANRPAAYFESKAFMDDFVYRYWDCMKHCG